MNPEKKHHRKSGFRNQSPVYWGKIYECSHTKANIQNESNPFSKDSTVEIGCDQFPILPHPFFSYIARICLKRLFLTTHRK